MTKKLRKLLAVLLVMSMITSLLSLTAFADENSLAETVVETEVVQGAEEVQPDQTQDEAPAEGPDQEAGESPEVGEEQGEENGSEPEEREEALEPEESEEGGAEEEQTTEEPQPSEEKEPEEEQGPEEDGTAGEEPQEEEQEVEQKGSAVQAFLDAVAALPEAASEENFEEVFALIEACQEAYDALSQEELADEDVIAAAAKIADLMEEVALLTEEQDAFGELKEAVEAANNSADPVTIEVSDTVEVTETLTISGNVTLTGGTLIRAAGMTAALISVEGTLTLTDITIDGNRDNVEALAPLVTVKSGASMTIDTGATLQNNTNVGRDRGGAINSRGMLTIKDGMIQNNSTIESGGGVYCLNGTVLMTGGEISNNESKRWSGAGGCDSTGGGVCIAGNASMRMEGGTISYNATTGNIGYGGGIALSDCTNRWKDKPTLIMTGGTIEGNTAKGCGGGIAVWSYTEATITGGDIINNHSNFENPAWWNYSYYGGGGIYINRYGKLTLKNVEIADNTANLGGGLAACPTSDVHLYIKNGGVFYNNTTTLDPAIDVGAPELFVDKGKDILINSKDSNVPVSITGYTLNGYKYNWTNVNGELATADELNCMLSGKTMLLNSGLTTEQGQRASRLCSVRITGNVSGGEAERSYGGGIGCNGILIIGEDTDSLVLEKKVDGSAKPQDDEFNFTLLFKVDEETAWTGKVTLMQDGKSSAVATNENGELSLTLRADEYVMIMDLPVGVTYTITEGENLADKVTISHTVTTGLDELKPDASTEVTEGSEITGTVIKGLDEILYTNTYHTQYTQMTVNKVWSDGTAAHVEGSVTVDILNAENEVVATITLSEQNNWTATVKGLPADSEYRAVEHDVTGYTPSYVINADGSVTITNTINPPPGGSDPDPDYTDLTVNKVWEGDEEGERPESILVQLYRNGKSYGGAVTLNESNGWSYEWSRLDDSYTWTVEEINVPNGYTSEVSQEGDTVTITNTYRGDTPDDPENPPEEDIPEEDVPLTDMPEPDVPLADVPKADDPLEEIPEEDVPLADVPKTGDGLLAWAFAALVSGMGLVWMALSGKKDKKDA